MFCSYLNIIKGNNKHSQVIMKVTRLLNIINVTQVGNNRFFPLNLSPLPVLSLLPLPVPCSLPPHFTTSCPLLLLPPPPHFTPSAPFSIPSPCSFPPHLSLFFFIEMNYVTCVGSTIEILVCIALKNCVWVIFLRKKKTYNLTQVFHAC